MSGQQETGGRKALGVAEHTLEHDGTVPVAVVMTLTSGQRVRVDLVGQDVTLLAGEPLKKRVVRWCQEIGAYLVRMALAEAWEEQREKSRDGAAQLDFMPRPDPRITWWA